MVRKRDWYTRRRAKRSRPKTPAPKTGWVISELARITEVPVRRLRYYVEHRLITPSEFRGTSTRYQRRELLRVLATVRLQAEARTSLKQIQLKLDTMTTPELEQWLRQRPLPPLAAAALGFTMRPMLPETKVLVAKPSSTWQRLCLMPGLELHISSDADPEVLLAAGRIHQEIVGLASG